MPRPADCLRSFIRGVDALLEPHRGGLSLLDWRLAGDHPPVASAVGASGWNTGILAVLTSGAALDEVIAETAVAAPARQALYALMDALRYEEEEDLRALPAAWPRIRDEIRHHVLGLVRDDVPDDVLLLDRALVACGLVPLSQPEPNPWGTALRRVFRLLLSQDLPGDRARTLRGALRAAASRAGFARQARFHLARAMSERDPLLPDAGLERISASERALLADPDPSRLPCFPAALAGAALLLLAALDTDAAPVAGGASWRGQSAYNVLRNVAGEARWSDDLRRAMDALLDGARADAGALAARALSLAGIDWALTPAPSATQRIEPVLAPSVPRVPVAPARVLLSKTEEEIYEFLARAFQEKRRPTYDDAQAEGWTRTTYSNALKSLESHGLLERKQGRPLRVFPRDNAH